MKEKVRPVGSRVPCPLQTESGSLPWEEFYRTEFTGSGTEALSIAIALAIQLREAPGQPEVIIPAYGCPDLIAAIVAQGAKPVLADLLPDSSFMSEVELEEAITASTVAVVGVGLLGVPERLDILSEFCRAKDLLLIEDSAQCFPPASSHDPLANLVVLSFGRGKPINLLGGGALLIQNDIAGEAYETLKRYPVTPSASEWVWRVKCVVFNLLLSRYFYGVLERLPFLRIGETRFQELEAISRLDSPPERLLAGLREYHVRPPIHKLYEVELADIEIHGWKRLMQPVGGAPELVEHPSLLRYALLAPSREVRDRAIAALNAAGIGASKLYGSALPGIDGIASFLDMREFPVAGDFASRLLTLPSHEDVTPADIELAARIISGLTS